MVIPQDDPQEGTVETLPVQEPVLESAGARGRGRPVNWVKFSLEQ